jgi:hypothetical protein
VDTTLNDHLKRRRVSYSTMVFRRRLSVAEADIEAGVVSRIVHQDVGEGAEGVVAAVVVEEGEVELPRTSVETPTLLLKQVPTEYSSFRLPSSRTYFLLFDHMVMAGCLMVVQSSLLTTTGTGIHSADILMNTARDTVMMNTVMVTAATLGADVANKHLHSRENPRDSWSMLVPCCGLLDG